MPGDQDVSGDCGNAAGETESQRQTSCRRRDHFVVLLAFGVGYTLNGLLGDIDVAHTPPVAIGAFVSLGIAPLIALGFEFVNGFRDTANAMETVIYAHSLPPHLAVVWSGAFNVLGVMVSSCAVAFSVLSLLPVELILQVGGSAGFAMIFALLIAAIVWNLGTLLSLRVRYRAGHAGVHHANQESSTGSARCFASRNDERGAFRAQL
jgi:PiT family inorganic phosphate transporter